MSYFFRIYPYPIKHYLFSNKHLDAAQNVSSHAYLLPTHEIKKTRRSVFFRLISFFRIRLFMQTQ